MNGVIVLTDRSQARLPLPEIAAAVGAAGARSLVLREKDLARSERAALAEALRAALAETPLIVAGPDPLGGHAVHLAAADPPAPPGVTVVGRSCHDADELAAAGGATYVTVSPVYPSVSKPGYGPALGVAELSRLASSTSVPVFALGGVETPERAAACVSAGAAGVAVMGAAMRTADPYTFVASIVAAVRG